MAESVVQHMRNCMCRTQTATTGRQLVNVKENIKFDVNVSEMQNPVDLYGRLNLGARTLKKV